MPNKPREYYLSIRSKFAPASAKLVIVAESPPASDEGKYFYNPTGAVTEWLFAALMKQLCVEPKTKDEGLREFQRRGWALIDATYEPVNKRESEAAKKEVILRGPEEMAADPKTFRRALRDKNFAWHTHGEGWEVEVGSPEHQAMLEVLTPFRSSSRECRNLIYVSNAGDSRSRSTLSGETI
jgi:hypothetical protein